MKRYTLGFIALATALAIAPAAMAAPLIVGTLGVGGGNDKWSATGVTFTNTSATERDATGDFALVFGVSPATTPTTIDMNVFTFATPDGLIFTTDPVGGNTATFTITGPIDVVADTAEFLNLSGTGTLNMTGYAPTLGTFSFTSTDSNNNFGTSGSSVFGFAITAQGAPPTVPEPSSFLLFGSGLLSFAGLVRRKLLN